MNDSPTNGKKTPSPARLSPGDVRRCTELLEAIVRDRALLAGLSDDERRALLTAAGRISRPETVQERRLVREFRRAGRRERRGKDRRIVADAQIRVAREKPVYVPPTLALPHERRTDERELQTPRNCYVCKAPYKKLHFFYDSMCQACGDFNYARRFQSAPLTGRVALLTGGRVKIGFQAGLKLLRAGAALIVTTRFPHDAAQRYAREPDFAQWSSRLQIHGLDLRHSPSVELFARYVSSAYERLDFILNNAAQTVRRPPGFFGHLLQFETTPWAKLPEQIQPLLKNHEECKAQVVRASAPAQELVDRASNSAGLAMFTGSGSGAGIGICASAQLSQIPYAFERGFAGTEARTTLFPAGRTDADLQQVDLRALNSWRLSLSEVATPEMLEVHLVNAVAPFVLCGKLKALMLRKDRDGGYGGPPHCKHIVNVSAMEGIFSRGTKTDKHPHTNMAKAALNMMTLTSAPDYARDGIFMNAVDTGWVTDEDPAAIAEWKREELNFQPPLDIVDGAARICDPIFSGLLTGEHVWGKFLKDYRASAW